MNKLKCLCLAAYCLISLVGCQSKTTLETNHDLGIAFLTDFANDYFAITYDETKTMMDIYNEQNEKIKPYFTEEGFEQFSNKNYISLPILASQNNKTDVSVDNVKLDLVFEETDNLTVGYTMTIDFSLMDTSDEQAITISIKKVNNEYKIYAFHIMKVPDILQKIS